MVEAEVEDEADEEAAAVVAPTSYAPAPISNIETIYPTFKDGVKNAASAITLTVMNGVTAVDSTSYTTAPTAATDWTATTPPLYGPIAHVFQPVVAHATATLSSALAEDVGWIPIKIVM